MFTVIGYRSDLVHFKTNLIHLLSDPGGIRIDYLPDQQFISNGNYFCQHCSNDLQAKVGRRMVSNGEAFRLVKAKIHILFIPTSPNRGIEEKLAVYLVRPEKRHYEKVSASCPALVQSVL